MKNRRVIWISAQDVLKKAIDRTGRKSIAKKLLKRSLQENMVLSTSTISVEEVDFCNIRKSPAYVDDILTIKRNEHELGKHIIGLLLWRNKTKSMFKNELWQWENGIFAFVNFPMPIMKIFPPTGERMIPPPTRLVMYGVHFSATDIEQCIADMPKGARPKRLGKNHPRKLLTEHDWDNILSEYRQDAEAGTLERTFGPMHKKGSQAKLERAIGGKCSFLGFEPSQATLRRKARSIIASTSGRMTQSDPT